MIRIYSDKVIRIKDMAMKFRQEYIYLRLALLFVMFLMSYSANAAPVIADTPCDSKYYETLAARAWLEAQREITQNQNIILKPDSVFEYTCFDRLLSELADHASQMLSETGAYGSPLGSNSMDNALNNLVGTALISYVGSNFGYYPGLLGGHISATGIKHTPSSISAGAYSCDIMERVWKAAKCINFITDNTHDGFFTFQEYSTQADKRHLPTACTSISANWTANINTALKVGPWTNDPLRTYLGETSAQNCAGSSCNCTGRPIPTGVKVKKKGVNTPFDEKVCLQAGCRYHPGGFALYDGGSDPGAGCYGR